MGLVDLQTDLKSVRYGKDRPELGYSGQPFIKTPIPSNDDEASTSAGNTLDTLAALNAPDFLLRGGISATRSMVQDVERLGRFFIDTKSPQGFIFVAKQNSLSGIGVRTQASGNGTISGQNEGIYTPLATLTQAGIGYIGGHTNKQKTKLFKSGTTLYGPAGVRNKNATTVVNQVIDIENEGEFNRLVALQKTKINNELTPKEANQKYQSLNISDNNQNGILKYFGGPNSALGYTNTNIPFATDNNGAILRTGVNNINLFNSGFFPADPPPPSDDLIIQPELSEGSENLEINDFNAGDPPIQDPKESGFNVFKTNPIKLEKEKILFSNKNTVTNRYKKSISTLKLIDGIKLDLFRELTSGLNPSDGAMSFMLGPTSVYKLGTLTNNSKINVPNSTDPYTLSQSQIASQLINRPNQSNPGSKIQDYRKELLDGKTISHFMGKAPEYKNNLHSYTDPGTRGNLISYSKGKRDDQGVSIGPSDQINAKPIYSITGSNVGTPPLKGDTIPFIISGINTDTLITPAQPGATTTKSPGEFATFGSDVIEFRAYINSLTDGFRAKWKGVKYMGRGEEFYNYGGFSRDVSLSFTVAAQSREEMKEMYRKLNYLASYTAPIYSRAGYMSGPLIMLTLGGWFSEQVGFIESLSYDVPQESPWEIGIKEDGKFDDEISQVPHIINVSSFKFTPIHFVRPEKNTLGTNEDVFMPISYSPPDLR